MSTDLALPAPMGAPDRIGQGTAIEQSRAVAQVQAAVIIARQYPRDVQRAIRAMREACNRPSLARQAFYEYKRAGQVVTGPTIKLAQELAILWGNVDFGMAELRLDPVAGESEMLAYAWDLESNSRFSQIVIVQHVRDKKVDGVKVAERLGDQRDVYEANTGNAARRLRESIKRVLPAWFFEEAEAECLKTIENPGDGLTLAQRIAQVLRGFETRWGVEAARVEGRVGKRVAEWTAWDVAQLTITGESIVRGDITADDAFPVLRVTTAELAPRPAPTAAPAPAEPVAAPEPQTEAPPPEPESADGSLAEPEKVTRRQLDKLHTVLTACGVTNREEKLVTVGLLAGRPLGSSSELTKDEAGGVIDRLDRIAADADPATALSFYLANIDADTADTTGGDE